MDSAAEGIFVTPAPGQTLHCGTITDRHGIHATVLPPQPIMFQQLIDYLNNQKYPYRRDRKMRPIEMGIGLAALCVRWGTYLATLIDPAAPLHPDLTEAVQTSAMIDDYEMKRINIEISANLSWIISEIAAGKKTDMDRLLTKAHYYLSMPYQGIDVCEDYEEMIVRGAREKIPALLTERPRVNQEQLWRVCGNAITLQTWRNGSGIEDIHGVSDHRKSAPLSPYERRLNHTSESELMLYMICTFTAAYRAIPAMVKEISPESVLTLVSPYDGTLTESTCTVQL